MCGKAKSTTTPSKIANIINTAMATHNASQECNLSNDMLEETDNIVPGMSMYVAYYNNVNELTIEEMKWGLYGFAGKTNGITFNSRIENIKSNFMSKRIQYNRGVIIIDGFYENKTNYFTNKQKCLVIPVLFDIPAYGLNVFTILTKPAEENIQHLHTRQPVVLDELNLCKWMNMVEYKKKIIINNISNMINICNQPLKIVNKKKIIFKICEDIEPEYYEIKAA